jgi:putative effector of murein hydrolase LrgA (UPF0299 family)
MKKVEKRKTGINNLNQLLMLSAWGAVLVIASFLFLFMGRWIDVNLNTEPAFMVGMFVLAIFLCIGRLYIEYTHTRNQMGNTRRHA